MYIDFWATQSINQEFKFKMAQNSKNVRLDLMVIQVLDLKLGIAIRISVTSATILTAKRYTKKYISVVGIMV